MKVEIAVDDDFDNGYRAIGVDFWDISRRPPVRPQRLASVFFREGEYGGLWDVGVVLRRDSYPTVWSLRFDPDLPFSQSFPLRTILARGVDSESLKYLQQAFEVVFGRSVRRNPSSVYTGRNPKYARLKDGWFRIESGGGKTSWGAKIHGKSALVNRWSRKSRRSEWKLDWERSFPIDQKRVAITGSSVDAYYVLALLRYMVS